VEQADRRGWSLSFSFGAYREWESLDNRGQRAASVQERIGEGDGVAAGDCSPDTTSELLAGCAAAAAGHTGLGEDP
jgi:hypothetical protein